MTTKAIAYIAEIDHLDEGAVLVRDGVPWDEYELLLTELDGRSGIRVSYDRGRLEIVTVTHRHEMYTRLIDRIVYLCAERYDVDVENAGSTTFNDKGLQQGAEPDSCFYITNASKIIGKRHVDLTVDPPPDILVEIDISHGSKRKHQFYAQISVPELWVYDERRLHFYERTDSVYLKIPSSKTFPVLSSEKVSDFLKIGSTEGQSAALRAFRSWLALSL